MKIFTEWFADADVWKLNTLWDYISYGLFILFGILIFWLIIRRMNKNRTPEAAGKRVAKRLRSIGGRGAKTYRNVVLRTPLGETAFELLWMARDRLYAVKVLPLGTRVSGAANGATWKLGCNDGVKTVENPIPVLEKQRAALLALLAANGFPDITVETFVVCADNYEMPRFDIKGYTAIIAYQNLREWRRKHLLAKKWFFDTAAVNRILTDAAKAEPGKEAK